MKTRKFAFIGLFLFTTALDSTLFAQGLVNLVNTFTTRVSTNATAIGGGIGLTTTNSQSFYYALLTAPEGTTDRSLFTFSGVYATNMPVYGRLLGGPSLVVDGWLPGEYKAFYVVGWSSNLGHDWAEIQPVWEAGITSEGFYGESMIVPSGVAGGIYLGSPLPPLNIFGPVGITEEFTLKIIPEPNPTWLGIVGVMVLAVRRRLRQDH